MAKNVVTVVVKSKDEASKGLDKVKGKVKGLGSAMGTALKAGALAGGVAIAGLGAASIKMAIDFEKSFAEVKTLLPTLSDEGFNRLRDDLLDLSQEMGIATDQAVPALYQAISAGVPPDNVIDFMRVASQAAIGGVTDLETAVDGITSVVNAYGAEAISAGEASDLMFTAVRLGKTDFSQLSSSLFNVIPTAASLGVGFEEVAASLATITAQGTPTSVATTSLRQAFVEASKGGTKLDKAIRDLTGKGMGELVKSGKTSQGVLDALRNSMPEQEFKDLFGSVEGLNAVLQITGPNAESFINNLREMETSAGATEAAFGTISETTSFKLNKAINILKIEMLKLGSEALPLLVQGLEVALPFLQEKVPVAIEKMKKVFTDIKPTLIDLGKAFMTGGKLLFDAIKPLFDFVMGNKVAMTAAILAIGAAILIAFGPVSLSMLAIIGLITAIGLVKENWDELKAKAEEIFGSIKATITDNVNSVVGTLEGIPVVGEIVMLAFELIRGRVEFVFNFIKLYIETILAEVVNVFQLFKAIFTGDWDRAWQEIKEIFTVAFDAMLEAMGLVLDLVMAELTLVPSRILAALGQLITLLYKSGDDVIKGFINGYMEAWKVAIRFYVGLPGFILTAIGDVSTKLWQKGKDLIQGLIDGMFSVPIPNPLDLIPDITPGFDVPGIPGLAHGGIVTRPTLALIGEAGPEAVVPLTGAGAGGGFGNTINIYINAIDGASVEAIAPEMAREIHRHLVGTGAAGLLT